MGKTGRSGSNGRRGRRPQSSTPSYVYILLGLVVVGLLIWILIPGGDTIKGVPVNVNTPVKPEKSKAVNITLDVSASMQGYSAAADYTDLISHLKGWNPKTSIWLGDAKLDSKKDIITMLAGGKVDYKGASLLNEDIKRLAIRAAKDSTVELFVTDGILSGSDSQIKSAPNWNYLHRVDLMNDVISALSGQKDLSASVYQLPVRFNGEYYDKENRHGKYNGDRYLYVIALGRPANIAALKQEMTTLKAEGDLSYSAEWHAIDTAPLASNFSIDNAIKKSGKENTEYFELNKSNQDPIIRIETKAFANNVQDSLFYKALADSMVVLMDSRRVVGIQPRYDSNYRDIRVEIPKGMIGNEQNFRVIIKRPSTDWIKRSSTDDDTHILSGGASAYGSDKKRTFLLEYLINGIRSGVSSSDTIYMRDFKIVKQQ